MKVLPKDVPGLFGIKDLDCTSQPIFKPGYVEYRPREEKPKAIICTEKCCGRSYLPDEVSFIR